MKRNAIRAIINGTEATNLVNAIMALDEDSREGFIDILVGDAKFYDKSNIPSCNEFILNDIAKRVALCEKDILSVLSVTPKDLCRRVSVRFNYNSYKRYAKSAEDASKYDELADEEKAKIETSSYSSHKYRFGIGECTVSTDTIDMSIEDYLVHVDDCE